MAIVQNPIIGRAKGQAGGVVFTTLNGQNVMKAKPNSYRDANTVTQQANRSLHTDIVRMASRMKDLARSLFEKQPSDMPAFSKLVQQLSKGVNRTGSSPDFDPRGIVIGSGSVDLNTGSFSYTSGTGAIECTWSAGQFFETPDAEIPVVLGVIDKSTKTIYLVSDDNAQLGSGVFHGTLPTGLSQPNLRFFLYNTAKLSGGADLQKVVK